MFRKPVEPNANALLKNKDGKKLRQDILKAFPCLEPTQLLEIIPAKAQILRSKLPAPSRILIYSIKDQTYPLFVDISGRGDLFPTVYTLWKLPTIVPVLQVNTPVSEFVMRGADVMLPGTRISQDELATFQKGEIRSIVAYGNPMPIGVGNLVVDAQTVQDSGRTGKALELVHVYGDGLWSLGPKTIPNAGFLHKEVVAIEKAQVTPPPVPAVVEGIDAEEVEISTSEMDELIKLSFLVALRTKLKSSMLPILTNQFYSKLMLPCRPKDKFLNLKKSSSKKLSTFLRQMQDEGVIELHEKDGVDTITWFTKSHSLFEGLSTYETAEQAEAAENAATGENEKIVPNTGEYPPEVVEAYSPHSHMKALFQSLEIPSKGTYSFKEIKDMFDAYIEVHRLQHPYDYKSIILDALMTDALFKGTKEQVPQEMLKQDARTAFFKRCEKYHAIKLYPEHQAKLHRGLVKPILLNVAKRTGNKVVTLVTSFEQFGVQVDEFLKTARKAFACSVSVQPATTNPKMQEIVIQGQFANEIIKLFTTQYKIPSKYIVATFAKGVSRKKK